MKTIRTWGFVALALVLLGVLALVYSSIVNAAGILVTSTADGIDATANCASVTLASLPGSDGQTTLREADIGALTLTTDVTINQASGQSDPTNASPVNFTVTFTGPVTAFDDAADVTLSGTAGATTVNITEIAPMNGTTYNVAVSGMSGTGTVIATVPANAALDGSSNGNTASTSTDNTVTYDGTPPTVTINQAVGQSDSTSTSPVHFTAIFSEPVTGFDGTDVTLSGTANPTTATITPSSGPATNYDVAISGMNASGTIKVSIPSGGAIDAANNFNTSSSTTTPGDTDTITNYTMPSPTLGNYPDTSVSLGGNTTITPITFPTNTSVINVSTSTNFKGTFAANPATGVVRVTNAHPAGTYTVTVTAFNDLGVATSKTFQLTVQQGTACAGVSGFTNAADVNVGPVPVAVAIGDFNNDGKQDMAVAIQNSNLVSIRLGDGLGGFSGTTTVSVGTFPRSVAVGDFNGDGQQDLAVANGGSHTVTSTTVSIRLGDGMGGFSGTTEVPVVNDPRSVAIGDFNNDGKQDFAAVNFGGGSNTVSIRLGDGAGNFSGTTNVPVGTSPEGVAIGDFNNDGNQDIAAANSGSANVSIRLGDGAGNFSGPTNVPVGAISSSVAIGDFNSDGKQDFAATNGNSNNVSIRLGDGLGGFSGTTNVPVGTFPFSVAIGDFNNDGKQDFAAANSNSATVSIRLGDGAGNFSGATNVPTDSSPQSVAIGDFNNDGKQDFATANTGVSTVSIRLGGCNLPPTITAASGLSRTQSSPVSNSQIATVTDDGGNGSVLVTVTSANPSNGVTISNIQNTGGNVTANIVADCTATNASFTLQASDGVSTSTATLNVTVNANTAPTLTYTDPPAVAFNGSTTVTPTTATDNDSITGYSVQSVAPALTTAPTVNSSGVVSITNAQPAGTHTITIRATDSCGVATDASFTLIINCGSTVVTNSNDNGAGSLRDVILHTCPGATITFNMTPGNVTSPITLTSGELVIDKNLTITGPGANALAISGNNAFRLMYVTGAGVNLTTNNLSFTGGGGNQAGSAIHFDEAGTLTINDCEFYGNSDSFGGTVAIHKAAAINVNRSTIRNNTTPTGISVSLTPANVLNSTISNNTGFGINNSSSNLTLANSTIANNPNGIVNGSSSGPASTTLSNVLLSNNGQNLRKVGANPSTFTSNGHNLIDDNTFSLLAAPGPGDLLGTSVQARLAPLAYNSGPTQTRALLPGSAALDAGDNTLATGLTTDQRGTGFNRVVNSTVDIGAFESRGFTITATSGTPQSTTILNAFGAPLIASVNGVGGEPVNGGIVTFTAPAANASAVLTGGGSTANVSIASGQASINATANGTAGSYNVSASAVGATSASFSLTNSKANTSTAVSSSVNPSDFGQSVSFTATVTAVAGTPTGTVQFKDNGTNIGAAVNLTAGGVAQVSTSTLTVGTHTITADYSGDANFLTSAATLSGGQVVKSQPSLSINDVSITEGDAGTKVLSFTVTLSAVSNLPVSVDYATANGTATGGSDYVATNGTFTFDPSDSVLTRTVNVTINGDVSFETVETLFVNLSNAVNATISDNQGLGTIQNDDAQGGFMSVGQTNYSVSESIGIVTVTVTRTNDISQAVNVDYATDDTGASTNCAALNTGLASQRCDYTSMFGTLKFAANETQKTLDIPINLDAYTEGPETFKVNLSNSTGGAMLVVPSTAIVTISDSASPTPNAIDDTTDFVRQQYRDFLNREADPAGLTFWKNNIDKCNDPAQRPPGQTLAGCIEVQRITTSAAFFLSLEFKGTGGLVRDFYVAALDRPLTNNMPGFVEFMRDAQGIQKGVVVGQGNWQQVLDANRLAFMNEFVTRAEFLALYPTTDTPTQYVDKLYQHAKVTGTQQERLDAIEYFGGAGTAADTGARARALLQVTQSGDFQARELNRGFVQMQYFGYLRRNPNDPPDNNFDGFNFWVNKLNQFKGDFLQAEMVKAFLSSSEYRSRFGP